ncbi:MAG TPA: aldehyde dehydrogenase family protein [Mycobacterium sp.]|nr:aldehyde dehydrogenase family protein [Mycobacterium sp.]
MDSSLRLVNPRTGQRRGHIVNSREREISAAVCAARAAQRAWGELTPKVRGQRLNALADRVEAHADVFTASEQAGTGKPDEEAFGEVLQVADLVRFYAWAARSGTAPAAGQFVDGYESWVRWEPLGVVAAVIPWNYPLLMAAWRCAPALAAGNTVLLKPAETTSDSAELLAKHARDTLGPDIVQIVRGDRHTGKLLVESSVDAIAFTGSLTAGNDVAMRAGIKRLSLELGGNGPVIVLPDAPENTWATLAAASTYNAGQSCAAPARVITFRENYDHVVASLAAAMKERHAGKSFGPLNNEDQLARYDRIVDASRARTVHTSSTDTQPHEQGGFWRPACVLADLAEDDIAVTEEVFGPVLTVQHADNIEDAIRLANEQPQALAASVWSSELATALYLASRINAGEVWLNCHLVQTAELPHGGRGASGNGTDLSILALHEYQRPKTITARLRPSSS